MNVSCPDCRSIFRVDPAKVPSTGVRARCSVCSGVISIPAPTGQSTPASGTPRHPGGSSETSQKQPRSAPQSQSGWDTTPFAAPGQRTPSAPPLQRPTPPPPMRTAEAPSEQRPRSESIDRAVAAATATPPSPTSGLPEFTVPQPYLHSSPLPRRLSRLRQRLPSYPPAPGRERHLAPPRPLRQGRPLRVMEAHDVPSTRFSPRTRISAPSGSLERWFRTSSLTIRRSTLRDFATERSNSSFARRSKRALRSILRR